MNNNEYEQTNLNQVGITQIEYATKTELNIEAATRAQNDIELSNQVNDKQDKIDQTLLNTASKTVVGAINELQINKTDKNYVDRQSNLKQSITDNTLTTTNKTIVGAINENVATIKSKQNILLDNGQGQNIKTINNQSLLGTGDIKISGESTELDNNIEIYDNENNNFVQYKATNLDWSKASNKSLTSKSYVDQQDTTITNSISTKQNTNDNNLTTTNKTIVGAINELAMKTINKQYLDYALVKKQDVLVNDSTDNQNIKTINGQYILGQGDLVIETPDVTKSYVDSQNINLQKQISKSYYWKPIAITGAGTRNVNVIGNLEINKIYKIAYTWSNNVNSNVTYREYLHLNHKNVDIDRYLHSSLIGLLPNVLALENNGNTGFRIYEAIGVQSTNGFIIAVYVLSKLD